MKILKFPVLVIEEILRNLDVTELFEFSQCSKRSASLMEFSGAKNFKLDVIVFDTAISVNRQLSIVIEKTKTARPVLHDFRRFGNSEHGIRFDPKKERMVTFFEDRYSGLRTVLAHLMHVFKCTTDSLIRCLPEVDAAVYMDILNMVMSRQSTIQCLDVQMGGHLAGRSTMCLLENAPATEKLLIHGKPSKQFMETLNIPFQSTSGFVYIRHASWITPKQLKSMTNCKAIDLFLTSFTNQQMVSFFESWQRGEFPKLEHFSATFKGSQLTDFTLPGYRQLEDRNADVVEKQVNGEMKRIFGSVQIQRNDGVIGRVCYNSFKMEVQMLVV